MSGVGCIGVVVRFCLKRVCSKGLTDHVWVRVRLGRLPAGRAGLVIRAARRVGEGRSLAVGADYPVSPDPGRGCERDQGVAVDRSGPLGRCLVLLRGTASVAWVAGRRPAGRASQRQQGPLGLVDAGRQDQSGGPVTGRAGGLRASISAVITSVTGAAGSGSARRCGGHLSCLWVSRMRILWVLSADQAVILSASRRVPIWATGRPCW